MANCLLIYCFIFVVVLAYIKKMQEENAILKSFVTTTIITAFFGIIRLLINFFIKFFFQLVF